MRKNKPFIVILIVACVVVSLYFKLAGADDDEQRRRGRYLNLVDNPTYKERCGECHFPYQPELLPSGSWCKILSRLHDHFDNDITVVVDAESRKIIAQYLEANAAEHSSARQAGKIMKGLKGQTPRRITETPYISHKHHEVPEEVFQKKSVGSFSNCIACHRSAEKGIYDEDDVKIPE